MSRKVIKSYIVDREFQYAYVARNLILLVLMLASVAVAVVVWNHYQFKQGYLLQPPTGEQVITWAAANNVSPASQEFAYQYMTQARPYSFFDILWKPLLIVLLINLVILTISGFYFSYKIAGPIYRMKNMLRDQISGKRVTPLIFRKTDPFHELSALVTEAMDLDKNN